MFVFCWFQVADILPTRSQADIMQRELESCLSLEYTPDSLPLLLHQVRTERQKIYAWNKKQKQIIFGFFFFWKVFKLKPVSFLYFYHSSSQTDLITWLRSDICSCWDGGDFATMPALLRSFIPIIRLPCVNEQHDLAVF